MQFTTELSNATGSASEALKVHLSENGMADESPGVATAFSGLVRVINQPSTPDIQKTPVLALVGRADDEKLPAKKRWQTPPVLYRSLTERMAAVTYVVSLEKGHPLLYVSSQLELFGFTPDMWLGKPDLRLQMCHSEDRNMLEQSINNCLHNRESFSCSYRIRCRNGEIRWIRDEAHIVRDDANNPIVLQGMIADVTADKQARDELMSLRHYLERQVAQQTRGLSKRIDILESCNSVLCERLEEAHIESGVWRQIKARFDFIMQVECKAVVFFNQDGKIMDMSGSACELSGWDKDSSMGHQILNVFNLVDARGHSWEPVQYLDDMGNGVCADVYIKYLDASMVPVRLSLSPVGDPGYSREYALTVEKREGV